MSRYERGLRLAAWALILTASVSGCTRSSTPQATEPSPEAAKPLYHGVHGKTNCEWIYGWAWDKANPDATVKVDIHDGPTLIATLTADIYRKDLKEGNIGTGKYGFAFRILDSLKDGKPHSIRITISGTTVALKDTPKTITCEPPTAGKGGKP
jgi:hypothetical protein